MVEYKLDPDRISEYTKRNDNRVLKIVALIMMVMPVFIYPVTQIEGAPPHLPRILTVSFLFTFLLMGVIYLNNRKLIRLSAENLVILVDDESITRLVDLDAEPRMNFLHKNAYRQAKNVSSGFYARIEFDHIQSMENRKGDLWIKSKDSNSLTGRNIVLVPCELQGFEEVVRIMQEKTS